MSTKKLLLVAVFSLIVLASTACGRIPYWVFENHINGSGSRITEERSVHGFDRVSLTGFGEVSIEQGDEESLTVRTDDNIMPYIETEVKNGTLFLGLTEHHSYDPTDGIKFDLVVKNLNQLEISGAGVVHADDIETGKLRVTLSGAGSLEFANLVADQLVLRLDGAGSAVMAGKVRDQDVTISGVGQYHAPRLESKTAVFEMSGVGSASLWVTENLDLELSSLGSVTYYGNPHVSQNISGLGKVTSMGGW